MKAVRFLSLVITVVVMSLAVSSCKGTADSALESSMEEINKELAMQSIPGIEKMEMTTEPGYVVYNYVVDESVVPIEQMAESASEQKQLVRSSVINGDDSDMKAFISLVKAAERGLKFVYTGNKSGESYEIVFDSGEF